MENIQLKFFIISDIINGDVPDTLTEFRISLTTLSHWQPKKCLNKHMFFVNWGRLRPKFNQGWEFMKISGLIFVYSVQESFNFADKTFHFTTGPAWSNCYITTVMNYNLFQDKSLTRKMSRNRKEYVYHMKYRHLKFRIVGELKISAKQPFYVK